MAISLQGTIYAAANATTVQVEPGPEFDWWPKAGQVLVLLARYEPGVAAVAPSGWTVGSHESRVLWKGREVDATCWWLQLQRDYNGWRYGMEPTPGIDQFELPKVLFMRANEVDLEFSVLDGLEVTGVTVG